MKSAVQLFLLFSVVVVFIVAPCNAQNNKKAGDRCGENEVYRDCGPSCQTECSSLGQPCLVRNIRCPDGCYCVQGYARDGSGKCIPNDRC